MTDATWIALWAASLASNQAAEQPDNSCGEPCGWPCDAAFVVMVVMFLAVLAMVFWDIVRNR